MRALFAAIALIASPALAQGGVSYPPAPKVDLSNVPTASDVKAAKDAADAAAAAAAAAVKTVNGLTPNAAGAVTLALPTAATTMPPCITDAGSAGTSGTMLYAPFNHTHCSKARRIIADTAADGTYTYNYAATPFTNPPVCTATARVPVGTSDVVNAQIVGVPSTTSMSVIVNRANRSVASLLGLTVLSILPSPGVTRVDIICLEP